MATKKCTKCQETKKLNEYGVDKRAFDGRRSECKRCMLVRAREYKRSLKGVSRDCLNASRRKWAATNRDKINGYNNRWVEANPEKLRELSRQKYKKDKHNGHEICIGNKPWCIIIIWCINRFKVSR